MYADYRARCEAGRLTPGRGFAWALSADDSWRYVYNLATQAKPGRDARLDAIEESLTGALAHAARHDVASIGLPRIGCGIGGLDWDDVNYVLNRVAARTSVRLVVVTPPDNDC